MTCYLLTISSQELFCAKQEYNRVQYTPLYHHTSLELKILNSRLKVTKKSTIPQQWQLAMVTHQPLKAVLTQISASQYGWQALSMMPWLA